MSFTRLFYTNQNYILFDQFHKTAPFNKPHISTKSFDSQIDFYDEQNNSPQVSSINGQNSISSSPLIVNPEAIHLNHHPSNANLLPNAATVAGASSVNQLPPNASNLNNLDQIDGRSHRSGYSYVQSNFSHISNYSDSNHGCHSTDSINKKSGADPKLLPYYGMPVSLYYDELCTYHNFKHFEQFDEDYDEHPEQPRRIFDVFQSILDNKNLVSDNKNASPKDNNKKIYNTSKINFFINQCRFAKKEEILLAHTEEYYNTVQTYKFLNDQELYKLSGEKDSLYLNRFTETSASIGLGTCLQAADDLKNNKNLMAAYCLTRPPGHHAYKHKGSGFCIYNNAAIVAKHLLVGMSGISVTNLRTASLTH